MEINSNTLNKALIEIIEETGLSQSDFAKASKVHKQNINKIIKGKEVLGWTRFVAILKNIGHKVDEKKFIKIF